MGLLNDVVAISTLPYNRMTVIIGKPGSGKTTLAGTYPKPMLYVSIGSDGGGVVLTRHTGIDALVLKSDEKVAVYHKLIGLLDELKAGTHGYKTILIDAYSSIEEDLVSFSEKAKGKKLSLDERGTIGGMMTRLRDRIVELAEKETEEYVLICHIKNKDDTDNVTGEKTIQIIPKMTFNNGNILLERASNVMYCCRKPVKDENGKVEVKFLTYIGAHPYIDTKLRLKGKPMETVGIYIENCTYENINEIVNGKELTAVTQPNVVDVPVEKNPFEEEKDTKEENW